MDTSTDCNLASCCGRCFRPVQPSIGGFVLSCGCFACFNCAKTSSADRVGTCMVCGKKNIQALSLSEGELPDDVLMKISDPLSSINKVCLTLNEHIQYYKQTIQKMRARMQQLNRENNQLKEMLRGGPEKQRQPIQSLQNSMQQTQQRPQTSLSSVLSNPINAATLPPSAGSLLGKRPSTSQLQQPQQRLAQQSAHFQNHSSIGASNIAEPPAKRAQTAQPLRPGTNTPSGGQRVEVSRVASRDPLQYQHQDPRNAQNQKPESFHQMQQRPQAQQGPQSQQDQQSDRSVLSEVSPPHQPSASKPISENAMWGFTGSGAASPSLSHTVTPRGQESDHIRDKRDNNDARDGWGEGRERFGDNRERMPPPVVDRPPSNPSVNRSPMFETPSRLRSPHVVVPRVGSSGGGSDYRPGSGLSGSGGFNNNRPGSGAGHKQQNPLGRLGSAGKQPGPANPFQGVGVTLSQHQMPPAFGAGRGGLT